MNKQKLSVLVIGFLIVSLVFNYGLSRQLKTSSLLTEDLEKDLEANKINQENLELHAVLLLEDVDQLKIELNEKIELLEHIEFKLEADGNSLERLDQVLNENEKLKKQVTALSAELGVLRVKESSQAEESNVSDDEITNWKGSLKSISDVLEARISVLEEGIKSLSILSFERLMVQEEIDFLESIHVEIKQLKNELQTKQ